MENIDEIDKLIHLARDADIALTQNARKIVLDILHQGTKPNTNNMDKILSLGKFSNHETLKQIGTDMENKIIQNTQKNKELSLKISQCVSKINQMSYDTLLVVLDQYSIGGVEYATNYILTGTKILRFKKYHC